MSKAYPSRGALAQALEAQKLSHTPAGLMTPPNSGPLKLHHSFSHAGEDDGEHDSALFPPHLSMSPSSSPRSPPRRIFTTTLPAPPRFEEMRPLGYSYDRQMLDRIEHHSQSPKTMALYHGSGVEPPSPEEYHDVLNFHNGFSRAYVERAVRSATPPALQSQRVARTMHSRPRARKVLQDATANRRAVSPLHQAATSAEDAENVPVTAHRRRRSSTAGVVRRRAHPKPVTGGKEAKSARAKSTKAQKSDNFTDYPDFSPAWNAMQRPMEHAVKAKDYGTHPLDLSSDPHRHLLHEAETELAQRLHLSGSKYLCVKRQLFEEYVKLLRHESDKQANWNKTAAQRVSNVDVTKTSVVWQFYHEIGWFEKQLFRELTDPSRDLSGDYYPQRLGVATVPTAAGA